jgi:hypothetical protein
MPFADDCIDLHPEPELPAVNREPAIAISTSPESMPVASVTFREGMRIAKRFHRATVGIRKSPPDDTGGEQTLE